MRFDRIVHYLTRREDLARQQAMVDAYSIILRPILISACAYYLFVTWEHWQTQTGLLLVMFSFISTTTALSFYLFHKHLTSHRKMSLARLEVHILAMHLFMYFNLLSYLLVYDAQTLEEVRSLPMRKPSGKYNVWNKITFSEGTSH